jgi:hypothetical protein
MLTCGGVLTPTAPRCLPAARRSQCPVPSRPGPDRHRYPREARRARPRRRRVLPRVPASLLGLDVGSDPRARCRQPRRRNEAASLPGLRRSSHQLDDHGTVEGPRLGFSQEVVIGRPICWDGKDNRHVDKTRKNEYRTVGIALAIVALANAASAQQTLKILTPSDDS